MFIKDIDSSEERFEYLQRAAARLRRHSLEITDEAGSGHPTSCLSCADIMSALFFGHLKLDTDSPDNPHNDRFILSKGHAAPILWAAYYEGGLIDRDALHSLRQIDSRQEGHPTPRHDWVDVATGSLGQGLPMGVGMAWAARFHSTDSHVYTLLGDGELAEGSNWEAAALAAQQSLGMLTAVVDINQYGQSDPTMLKDDVESYERRFAAFGWQTIKVDGHDIEEVSKALSTAHNNDSQPTAILALTEKGKGVPEIEGSKGKHGKPAATLEQAVDQLGEAAQSEERELAINPTERSEPFPEIRFNQTIGRGEYEEAEDVATREAFGKALLELGLSCQNLVALDGDVKNSTKLQDFFDKHPERSIECYIAEQCMIGTAIGLSKSGVFPCAATFAAFLTRAFDQLRMAAISRSKLLLAGSHAGVAVGEDGPTQMGLEDLAMIRSLPGSLVLYPSDAVSTYAAVEDGAQYEGIAYIRLNRGKTPVIYQPDDEFKPGGCKIWNESKDDQVTLIGAGVTLFECLTAQKALEEKGISVRVVDCYSVKPIPRSALRRCAEETRSVVVVEDHYAEGGIGEAVLSAIAGIECEWRHLAIEKLSRSGPSDALLDHHGISSSHIEDSVHQALSKQS